MRLGRTMALAVFTATCLASWIIPTDEANAACPAGPVTFASCDQSARNFGTVLLAVHGWNGDCASTFGTGDGSLFRVLDAKFYDVDCFEYDSLRTSLDTNVQRLHAHLKSLHGLGYRQVMLVTHSTGGILALRLLANISLADRGLATESAMAPLQGGTDDSLLISAVHAWATPIIGVRWGISLVSHAGAIFSPETLKDLREDSAYLKTLRQDLATLRTALRSAPAGERSRVQVPIVFYQGQEEDRVVLGIDRAQAEAQGWWPYEATMTDSGVGHSYNVGDDGVVLAPKFAAKVMELQALLGFGLRPRLTEIFPMGTDPVTSALEARQLAVVDGMTAFARVQLNNSNPPLGGFLKRVIGDSFARSQTVDERLMDGLKLALEDALGHIKLETVRTIDALLKEALAGYAPGSGQPELRFGERSSKVAKAFVQMLKEVRVKVNDYMRQHPEIAGSVFAASGSLTQFNANLLGLQARVLASPFPDAKLEGLDVISSALPAHSSEEVAASGVPDAIIAYSQSNLSTLQPADKLLLSKAFTELLRKDTTVSKPILQKMSQPIRWLGADRPLWSAIVTPDQLTTIIRETRVDDPELTFKFMTDVIRQSGPTLVQPDISKLAADRAHAIILASPEATQGRRLDDLKQAGQAATSSIVRQHVDSLTLQRQ